MILDSFKLEYYDDVVDMYYEFIKEVYQNRKIGEKYFFHRKVSEWINTGKTIIVAIHNENIIGFSLTYIRDMSGITEPVYFAEIAYVKPEYRKTRAAYMLYHNSSEYAKENNLTITGNAMLTTEGSQIIDKHFKSNKMFINYERNKNEY